MCCGGSRPKAYFVIGSDDTGETRMIQACVGGDAYDGWLNGWSFDNWSAVAGPFPTEQHAQLMFPNATTIDELLSYVPLPQISNAIGPPNGLVWLFLFTGIIVIAISHGKIKR